MTGQLARRGRVTALRLATLASILIAWQAAAAFGLVSERYVSRPTDVATALLSGLLSGSLRTAMAVTLGETLVGFGLAVIAGSVAAFFLYQWPTLAEVCRPFITALNNLPRIALTPLFVLWLGFGPASRVALVISLSFFVVLLSGLAGLQSANPEHLRLARLLGASRVQSVVTFVLPGALPTYFAGLQLALTYAFLGAVVGEMLAGAGGLGGEIQLSIATYRTDDFFAALLLVAVMATILSALLQLLERRFLGWREGTQP